MRVLPAPCCHGFSTPHAHASLPQTQSPSLARSLPPQLSTVAIGGTFPGGLSVSGCSVAAANVLEVQILIIETQSARAAVVRVGLGAEARLVVWRMLGLWLPDCPVVQRGGIVAV